MQYSDNNKMFEAEDYFSADGLKDLFVAYITKGDWKSKAKWSGM